jgi:phosphoribosylanthranilate isomerase
VAESGIKSSGDIALLAENGVDAVLIGETLMKAYRDGKLHFPAPVRVKLCGLWRMEDIEAANTALPDYIGFVFAESRRRVDLKTAASLKAALDPRIKAVGVFVNEGAEEAAEAASAGVIDLVQLHGDEDAAYIKRLKSMVNLPVIKAVPMGSGCPSGCGTEESDYLLLDTFDREKRGGAGKPFDWGLINSFVEKTKKPFFLAGGLNETNLEAAAKMEPFCLDISSGAETNGLKDREKMIRIVRTVRELSYGRGSGK